MKTKTHPHILIVGAGFGGLEAARRLASAPVRITLIDRHNYHLFQPLLYQIAIAGLTPSQIAYPVRTIFRHQKNFTFQKGEVTGVNFNSRYIKLDGSVIAYDYLILAFGGRTDFFKLNPMESNIFELKGIESAVALRNHLLEMFEQAGHEADPEKRRALSTFVVAGGGPSGVETAGALAELIHHVMTKDYPQMDLKEVCVLLLEGTDHLMGNYPTDLRKTTFDLLSKKHVEISLNTRLVDFNGQQVILSDGRRIPSHTLIWTAGVRAAELADGLGVKQTSTGRVPTLATLQLADHPEVFVIGDAAHLANGDGQPLPMLATVAQQEASAAVKNIQSMLKGEQPKAFHYHDPGLLATVGRNAAVAHIGGLSFSGYPAWLIWVALHIFQLIGFRNRIVVLINWAWDYLFYESQVRLITSE